LNTIQRRSTVRTALLAAACAGGAALGARPVRAQDVDVSGVVYSQYSYQLADEADGANAFDVTRAYLNFEAGLAQGVDTRITADLYRADNGSLDYRLKYAYFAWTPDGSHLTYKLGQIHTPWVDWEEGLWGYRMQGPVALDRFHYLTSSDLGAGIDGGWNAQKVNMQLTVTNGEGYHAPEGDKHKDVAGRVSYRLVSSDDGGKRGGLRLTGLAHLGTATGGGTRRRLVGMLSYRSSTLTLAGEAGRVTDGGAEGGPNVDGNVLSAFGVVALADSKASLVGRVDLVDPNADAPDDRQTHTIAGISYRLTPNVLLLADLDHTSYQGGVPTGPAAARRSILLFQSQFTF